VVFGDALKATEPLPVPDAPDVIDSQFALLAAAQVHPACVLTAIGVPAPPAPATDVVCGTTE
jgi:hypothetical protein